MIRRVPEKNPLLTIHKRGPPRSEALNKNERSVGYTPAKIWVCNVFKRKDISDRMKLAKENKACLACLEIKCPGSSDSSKGMRKFTCTKDGCNEAHNSVLHL